MGDLHAETVVRQRREELGLTRSEAAAHCRVSATTFRLIEQGFQPHDATATRIEKALGLTPGTIPRQSEVRCPECDWLAPKHRPGCDQFDGLAADGTMEP